MVEITRSAALDLNEPPWKPIPVDVGVVKAIKGTPLNYEIEVEWLMDGVRDWEMVFFRVKVVGGPKMDALMNGQAIRDTWIRPEWRGYKKL